MDYVDTDSIGPLLRACRGRLGLSQPTLAARVGVSTRLWSEVERGERPNVSFATVARMLASVGVRLHPQEGPPSDEPLAITEIPGPEQYEKDLREAEAYGVDISLLRAGLRETAAERIRSNDDALAFFAGVSLIPGGASLVDANPSRRHDRRTVHGGSR
jgi:transcriptional regulator with XRE-family HTH domain